MAPVFRKPVVFWREIENALGIGGGCTHIEREAKLGVVLIEEGLRRFPVGSRWNRLQVRAGLQLFGLSQSTHFSRYLQSSIDT